MTLLQTSSARMVAVDVPPDSFDHCLVEFGNILPGHVVYACSDGQKDWFSKRLPSGSWEILSMSDSITEEQAKRLFEHDPIFNMSQHADGYWVDTALEAFQSLLTANGVEGAQVLILIQR